MFDEAPLNYILYPTFALFFLVTLVFLRMRSLRFAAVRRNEVSVKYYRAFTGDEEPEEIRVVTRNFINLFEVPVLFYVVVSDDVRHAPGDLLDDRSRVDLRSAALRTHYRLT
jgi:hypothetical protein